MSAWSRNTPGRVRPFSKWARPKDCGWGLLPYRTSVKIPMIAFCISGDVAFSSKIFPSSLTSFLKTFAPLSGHVEKWLRSSIGKEQIGQLCESWCFRWNRILDSSHWLFKGFVLIWRCAQAIRFSARQASSHKILVGLVGKLFLLAQKAIVRDP